jgi:hypothetical protein
VIPLNIEIPDLSFPRRIEGNCRRELFSKAKPIQDQKKQIEE